MAESRSYLSMEKREELTRIFLQLDTDGNGWLSREEVGAWLRGAGYSGLTDHQIEASFNAIDTNDDGKVTLDEFLAVMGHIEETNPRAKKEAKLRRVFRDMDADEDGLLTEKELMDGMRDAGYNLSRDQAKKLCNDLDKNGDGKIDFEEFIQMFQL